MKKVNKYVSYRITYLNFFLAAMIVALHGVSASNIANCNSVVADAVRCYYRIFIDGATGAFFALSGLLTFREAPRDYLKLLKKRFFSLMVPYLIFNVMAFVFNLLYDAVKLRGRLDIREILRLNNVIEQIVFKGANLPMWFIPVLFSMIILYPIIWHIVKNKYICIVCIAVITLFNLCIGVENGYSTIRYWLPEYLMGAMFGYHMKERIFESDHLILNKCFYVSSGIVLFGIVYCASFNKEFYYLYRLIVAVIFYLLIDCIVPKHKPKWIFECSFFIFGTHFMLVKRIERLYFRLAGYGMLQGVFANIILPILDIAVILIFAQILRKLFPDFWKICTGGRSQAVKEDIHLWRKNNEYHSMLREESKIVDSSNR